MSGGDVYTRWGRTSCPSENTETIYTGVIGGSHYSHSGGSNNYLCLPNDPQRDQAGLDDSSFGYIYGTEYEIGGSSLFKHLQNKEEPCAVCKTNARTVIMIPVRTTCYSGWRLEYSGYLMSQHHSQAGSKETICVDASPEATTDSFIADQNGALLYFIKTSCGSLKCPPYGSDTVLTCVVCSR